MKYDTYLAYSQGVDEELAEALESALNRSSKPIYGFGHNRVFSHRSKSGGYLASSEVEALEQARFFILLASPESAHSEYERGSISVIHQAPIKL